MTDVETVVVPVQVIVVIDRYTHTSSIAARFGKLVFSWQAQRGEIIVRVTGRGLDCKVVRPLRARQLYAVHLEVIALRLTAKYRMVIDEERLAGWIQAMEMVCRR